jgi:hypothetical protein
MNSRARDVAGEGRAGDARWIAELTNLERTAGRPLDEPDSKTVLARLRASGAIGSRDWAQILGWYAEALRFLGEAPDDADGVVSLDADPRNADWLRICHTWSLLGHRLPYWATLWCWYVGHARRSQFWQRIASASHDLGSPLEGEGMMTLDNIQTAISCAQDVARAGRDLQPAPNGFRTLVSKHYRAGEFEVGDTRWAVCTAPMISSSFQLLDATVNCRLERGAAYAVALLGERALSDGNGPNPTRDYLRKYQQIAWSAFGVVWVLDAGKFKGQFLADPAVERIERGDFDRMVRRVEKCLRTIEGSPRPKNSRDAEKKVRPVVERALSEFDFQRARSRQYPGFWRRPTADGMWTRESGWPASFALEVKLDEDYSAPLAQAVEPLGAADAMIYVRLVGGGATPASSRHANEAKKLLESHAPMRYLEVRCR